MKFSSFARFHNSHILSHFCFLPFLLVAPTLPPGHGDDRDSAQRLHARQRHGRHPLSQGVRSYWEVLNSCSFRCAFVLIINPTLPSSLSFSYLSRVGETVCLIDSQSSKYPPMLLRLRKGEEEGKGQPRKLGRPVETR